MGPDKPSAAALEAAKWTNEYMGIGQRARAIDRAFAAERGAMREVVDCINDPFHDGLAAALAKLREVQSSR